MNRIIKKCFSVVTGVMAVALTVACGSDTPTVDEGETDSQRLTVQVSDTDWQGEVIAVSRAGETLDALKSEGFGIYCPELLSSAQRQVSWNVSTGQWDTGSNIYWRRTSAATTFPVYAYAPYSEAGYTVTAGGLLTFAASDADGQNTDLLYAGTEVKHSDGLAMLTFNHALAKIAFGTITNNTGEAIALTQIAIAGDLYPSGQLNLMDGSWTATTPTAQNFTRTIDSDDEEPGNQPLEIGQGQVKSISVNPFLLIPGPTAMVTLTFSSGDTFSFTTLLERGRSKTYNITVEKNFEVVIA